MKQNPLNMMPNNELEWLALAKRYIRERDYQYYTERIRDAAFDLFFPQYKKKSQVGQRCCLRFFCFFVVYYPQTELKERAEHEKRLFKRKHHRVFKPKVR